MCDGLASWSYIGWSGDASIHGMWREAERDVVL